MTRFNSILQQTLTTARILKRFGVDDLLASIPNAKEATIRRYLTALMQNGNIKKLKEDLYLHVSNRPIKVRIGSEAHVINQVRTLQEFNQSTLQKRSNTSLEIVKKVLKEYVELGFLKQIINPVTKAISYQIVEKKEKKNV